MIENARGDWRRVLQQETRLSEEVSDDCNVTLGCVHKDLKWEYWELREISNKENGSERRDTHMTISSANSRVHPYKTLT